MAEHSTLTGANLHEPKGAASAAANTVYVADGAGSGAWTAITDNQGYVVSGVIADVSTGETVYFPIPYSGTVARVTTVLEGAITVADATITPATSAGNMETITVAFTGSAAGDVDSVNPATNNTVTDNDWVSITTDGGSTTAQRLWVSVTIVRG